MLIISKLRVGIILCILLTQICSIALPSSAQTVCGLTTQEAAYTECLIGYSDFQDNINANLVVQDMLTKVKAPTQRFIVKTCPGLGNAVATKLGDVPYILLDVSWMESVKPGRSDWFHLFVIAHEIGHHLLGHIGLQGVAPAQQREKELAADTFAGYVLGTYGITKNQVDILFLKVPDIPNNLQQNSTHPKNMLRIAALRKGVEASRSSEGNRLLQNLTKEAVLDLESLPYLVTMARSKYSQYITTQNRTVLQEAIHYYQQAIRFSNAPYVLHELGAMFMAIGDGDRYVQSLEYLYLQTKETPYLVESASYYSFTRSARADNFLQKHRGELDDMGLLSTLDDKSIIALVKYHLTRLEKQQSINAPMLVQLQSSVQEVIARISQAQKGDLKVLAEAHNALGLINLQKDDFLAARENFKASTDCFTKLSFSGDLLEFLFKYYSHNRLASLSNLSLANIRLADWEAALSYVEDLDQAYLGFIATAKRGESPDFDYSQVDYYKARVQQGLKHYGNAVDYYSKALVSKPEAYLFYYRGVCLLNLARESDACADFQKACSLDGQTACDRYKMLCH
jgi:tetratricopeptide (TPR) repeat protein